MTSVVAFTVVSNLVIVLSDFAISARKRKFEDIGGKMHLYSTEMQTVYC